MRVGGAVLQHELCSACADVKGEKEVFSRRDDAVKLLGHILKCISLERRSGREEGGEKKGGEKKGEKKWGEKKGREEGREEGKTCTSIFISEHSIPRIHHPLPFSPHPSLLIPPSSPLPPHLSTGQPQSYECDIDVDSL